jgi:hypothetical protein
MILLQGIGRCGLLMVRGGCQDIAPSVG